MPIVRDRDANKKGSRDLGEEYRIRMATTPGHRDARGLKTRAGARKLQSHSVKTAASPFPSQKTYVQVQNL